ncbi:hypothetical protein ACLIMP_15655 [Novosphingobium aerophilum]|uniref:hypothetical protein n=1 Tax=Novosphingobium TaxID=165696 RepID=UPI002D77BB12|nr:hypothetical protein [Novosphingobium sp. RL4]WRT92674.1 hypothetical protein U9J33_15980 [Novosphingobium sp. RL4]
MDETISLSACHVAEDRGIVRQSPRPENLRNAAYAAQFDWRTIFYDVYRSGPEVVLQGPPFLNFLPMLKAAEGLRSKFRPLWPKARLVDRSKGCEIRLRHDGDTLLLDGALGRFDITVQPDLSHLFAGRRVIHTLSRNNDIRWIKDWIAFYVAIHGADGVLLYDNGSTAYTLGELRAALEQAFPDMAVAVVDWPFIYGPQGGLAGAVDGRETPWDSDYCQTGSLQHARFRFLRRARSVLNVDIDELVLSSRERSIFAETEASKAGFIKFGGAWISSANHRAATPEDCRHGDFLLRDREEQEICPPKWCIVPDARHDAKYTWSVHNVFGSPHNRTLSPEFGYRHMKGISNSWKYDRWERASPDPARFVEDPDLRAAFERSGLIVAEAAAR